MTEWEVGERLGIPVLVSEEQRHEFVKGAIEGFPRNHIWEVFDVTYVHHEDLHKFRERYKHVACTCGDGNMKCSRRASRSISYFREGLSRVL